MELSRFGLGLLGQIESGLAMAMRCSGSSFGVEGGERMPPNPRRREQRQLKWLHGLSRLIQQGECQHQPSWAFGDAVGSNGSRSLNSCSIATSKDGFILSVRDHVFGEVCAGEEQDLLWLGLWPIFKPTQATNWRCPSPTTTSELGRLSSEFAFE
jgi:hypothetical protein